MARMWLIVLAVGRYTSRISVYLFLARFSQLVCKLTWPMQLPAALRTMV